MNININDIFEFCELRFACHIKSLNYFAAILGYQFPDHDSDKIKEPVRTGYAYIFYQKYHDDFYLSDEYYKLCEDAKRTHHEHAPHHFEYYKDVSDIPDIRVYEMVSDWASANFEQRNIMHDKECPTLTDWFNQNRAQYNWSDHQREIIYNAFKIISEKTDEKIVEQIWAPLVEKI